ncbi:MAG: recombinase RecT [Dehalococcoidales bacterium]|nr:recombinase RecT [Dehalococcoidales bacterium]
MTEEKTQAVSTRATDPNQSLAKMLNDAMPELRKVAPKYVNLTRMVSLAIEAKMRNPLLEKCSPVSVLNFCKRCAETGTDRVGAGGMWAVPFWSKKQNAYEMVPMPDWRLIVEKAKKAKAITHATAEAVYENDVFEYERGLNPILIHKPALSNRGKLKAVYCVYVLPDGTKDFTVMDIAEDIEPIHKRSKAADSGPWVTDYAEMAKKTAVKRAMKAFEGASIELTALISTDNIAGGYIDAESVAPRAPVTMPVEMPETTASAPQQANPESDQQDSPAEQSGGAKISDAQAKRLFAIAHKSNVSDETLHAYLQTFGIQHSTDIPRALYDKICAWTESGGQDA